MKKTREEKLLEAVRYAERSLSTPASARRVNGRMVHTRADVIRVLRAALDYKQEQPNEYDRT